MDIKIPPRNPLEPVCYSDLPGVFHGTEYFSEQVIDPSDDSVLAYLVCRASGARLRTLISSAELRERLPALFIPEEAHEFWDVLLGPGDSLLAVWGDPLSTDSDAHPPEHYEDGAKLLVGLCNRFAPSFVDLVRDWLEMDGAGDSLVAGRFMRALDTIPSLKLTYSPDALRVAFSMHSFLPRVPQGRGKWGRGNAKYNALAVAFTKAAITARTDLGIA